MKPKLGWPQNCFPRLCNWKPRLASKTIIFLQNIRNLSCPYKNEVYLQIKARKSFSHVKFFCVPEASSFFHFVEKNQSQAVRDWTIVYINSLMTWLKNCFFLLMLAQYPYTIEEENFTWISRVKSNNVNVLKKIVRKIDKIYQFLLVRRWPVMSYDLVKAPAGLYHG